MQLLLFDAGRPRRGPSAECGQYRTHNIMSKPLYVGRRLIEARRFK